MSKIHYISQVPGIGKTRWALRSMVKRILKGDEICFYVAPTVDLLMQVRRDLIKRLLKAGMTKEDAEYVPYVLTADSIENRSTIVDASRKAFVDSSGPRSYKPIEIGRVVFMTHAGFYRVPLDVLSKVRENSVVFFDEAKREVDKGVTLRMSSKANRLFRSLFRLRTIGDGKYSQALPSTSSDEKREAIYQRLIKSLNAKQISLVRGIIEDIMNPRLYVYISSTGNTFYSVSTPGDIFTDFKRAYIMSAYFENSQMFHLLSLDRSLTLIDYTPKIKNIQARIDEIHARYRKVIIQPLTDNQSVLSKNQLNGFMIPTEHIPRMKELLDEYQPSVADLRFIKRALCFKNVIKSQRLKELTDAFRELEVNHEPIEWYLDFSVSVCKAWAKKKNIKYAKPLTFVNTNCESVATSKNLPLCSIGSRGSNAYSNYHSVLFMAAVNPDNQHRNFLKALLGDAYSTERDFVVDTCLQAINRCSIRDTRCNEPVLIIVPDLRLAEYVKEAMHDLPTIVKPPKSVSHTVLSIRSMANGITEGDRMKYKPEDWKKEWKTQYFADDLNRSIRNKASMVSQYKAQLMKDIPQERRHKIVQNLQRTQAELEELRKLRNEKKIAK